VFPADFNRRLLLILPSIGRPRVTMTLSWRPIEKTLADFFHRFVSIRRKIPRRSIPDDLSRLARSSRRSLMTFLHAVANLNVDVRCQVHTIPPCDETRSRSLAFARVDEARCSRDVDPIALFLSSRSLCSPHSSLVQSINRYFGPWLIIRWIESESGAESELLVIARRSRVQCRADKSLNDKQQIMSHANFPRNFSKPRSDPSSL